MNIETPVFPLFYFGPVSYYSRLAQQDNVIFEAKEHYLKQTYRNRCSIYGANGRLNLSIPTARPHVGIAVDQISISYVESWQHLHWKSIAVAYRSSPYFEYYEDHFRGLYQEETTSLLEFNMKAHQIVLQLLQLDLPCSFTEKYSALPENLDFRLSFPSKKTAYPNLPRYMQVFDAKYGFIQDLSILDLLFNEGPSSITYLKHAHTP